jgi:hypothetical protein
VVANIKISSVGILTYTSRDKTANDSRYLFSNGAAMKFSFEVGNSESHQIEFQWSKWLGVAKIWVDGALILKSRPLAFSELAQLADMRGIGGTTRFLSQTVSGQAALQMIRGWEFEVGGQEKHAVRIEKERPVFLAAIRPHIYRLFIDGQLASEYRG